MVRPWKKPVQAAGRQKLVKTAWSGRGSYKDPTAAKCLTATAATAGRAAGSAFSYDIAPSVTLLLSTVLPHPCLEL